MRKRTERFWDVVFFSYRNLPRGLRKAVTVFFSAGLERIYPSGRWLNLRARVDTVHEESQNPYPPKWLPVKILALYLPQFHEFKLNNRSWGSGFTEWTSVDRSRPRFGGHNQPRAPLPNVLGRYDLVNDVGIFEKQAALARKSGIFGFNFYWYWSDGETQMRDALESFLHSSAAINFCLTWANESWTRAWDGASGEVIWEQNYSRQAWTDMLVDLVPFFSDSRYIRVNDRPLLYIYRPGAITFLGELGLLAEQALRKYGISGVHLVGFETFGDEVPLRPPLASVAQFPPHPSGRHSWASSPSTLVYGGGQIVDYEAARDLYLEALKEVPPLEPSLFLEWDNSARRQDAPTIVNGFSTTALKEWIVKAAEHLAVEQADKAQPGFITINAWNEWTEGSYLEPDTVHGMAYLEAVRESTVLTGSETALCDPR